MLIGPLAFAIETAALMSARCTSPWGMLPSSSLVVRVDFLGVEADVVGEGDQLLHELGGFVEASDPGERVGEPERAAQESAFGAAKAVLSAVAGDQRTAAEIASERVDRRRQPAGVRALVAEQDPQKQAGVELLPAGVAGVAAQSLRTSSVSR